MLFAHIQFPIIDFRYFLNDEYKRTEPLFPTPNANTWLRNFGHVRNRRTDTCPYYIAENKFCEAHNAVKFDKLPLFIGKEKYERSNGQCDWIEYPIFDKICKFRRFRSDGELKSCFEIGMEINPIETAYYSFVHWDLEKLFVKVKNSKNNYTRTSFFELGEHICKLYEESTRIKNTPIKTVYSGNSFSVYINYNTEGFRNYELVSHKEFYRMGIGLCHYYDIKTNTILWILDPWKYHYDKKLLAAIRRALLSISLEKETLLAAYNFLLTNIGKNFINEGKVISYIKKTQEKLLKQIRFDLPQSSIVDVLFKIDFENNQSFYYEIVRMISKVGDKYIANDFNKLFIELEFIEWRKNIDKELLSVNDKELRKKLKKLRNICIAEDRDKFWDFISKYKLDVIGLNVLSNWLTRLLGI